MAWKSLKAALEETHERFVEMQDFSECLRFLSRRINWDITDTQALLLLLCLLESETF